MEVELPAGPGMRYCFQAYAFRGNQDLGSSNSFCFDLRKLADHGCAGAAPSVSADEIALLTFVNRGSETRDVFWIGYAGERVYYSSVGPKGVTVQSTYVSHGWEIRDETGNCLSVVYAPRGESLVDVDGPATGD